MFYLVSLAVVLDSSFYVRAYDSPVAGTRMKRAHNSRRGEVYERITSGEHRNWEEHSAHNQESQKTKGSSLLSLANIKNLKNITAWAASHIKHPDRKFKLSSCACQNHGRLRSFFSEYARRNPFYPKIKAAKVMQPDTMFQVIINNSSSVLPENRLCLRCYALLLDYGVSEVDLLLKKNNAEDTILYLPEVRQEWAPYTGLPKHLRPVFAPINYIPWIMKLHSSSGDADDPYKQYVGELSMAKNAKYPPLLGLDKYVLKRKELISDALGYWRNVPHFKLKEDPIAFLKRTFSKGHTYRKNLEWRISIPEDEREQTSIMRPTYPESDSSSDNPWEDARNDSEILPPTASDRSTPTIYSPGKDYEEEDQTGIYGNLRGGKVARVVSTNNNNSYSIVCSSHGSVENINGENPFKDTMEDSICETSSVDDNDSFSEDNTFSYEYNDIYSDDDSFSDSEALIENDTLINKDQSFEKESSAIGRE